MNQVYEPLKDPAADGYTFVGVAVDPAIEKSLAPSKEDWKEPLLAKFKKWAFGFGGALLVITLLLSVLYLWKKSDAALQAEPITMTIEPIPQATRTLPVPKRQKSATEKIAAEAINTQATPIFEDVKPVLKESSADDPLAPALAEFNKQLINFESKL